VEDKRFALLIDSDNVSAEYVQKILDELTKYGIVTIKRIYGDWTKSNSNKWKTVLLSNSIQPMQQFAYTNGKNATDSFMIIDAMDILYSNNVEGFCLVTSDSDFTRLASRLREAGKNVIGMGETKTPEAFVSACDRFIYLDNISGKEQDDKEKKHVRSMKSIERAIIEILDENEDDGKPMTNIGEVGSRLLKKYPDFDVRNYGYTKFSTFCEGLKSVKIHRNHNIISLINASRQDADVETIMKNIIQSKGGSVELSQLSLELKQQISGFSVKNYGFSQFKKFVKSFAAFTVVTDKESRVISVKLSGK
jgi:uncharacterized protein (TIGR00288 family)